MIIIAFLIVNQGHDDLFIIKALYLFEETEYTKLN